MIKRRIKCCKCGRRETTLVAENVKRGHALCWECEQKARSEAKAEEQRRKANSWREMTTKLWWID